MLNGIGGKTISEAKNNISYLEALTWQAYIKKYGSLNIGRRVENQTGVLGSTMTNGKVDFSVFAPLEFENNKTQIQEVVETFGAQASTNDQVKQAQLAARSKRKNKNRF